MTAFASRSGRRGALLWDWELRSVNGRGLDLRLRLPDGMEGLEAAIRARVTARLSRGSVTLVLRLGREGSDAALAIDEAQLDRVLSAFERVQERAFALGVTLAQPTAADVLAQRGVVLAASAPVIDDGLDVPLLADLDALLADAVAARAAEGAALHTIVAGQLAAIAALCDEAARLAEAHRPEARAAMSTALGRVLAEARDVDEARIVQELAIIAMRSDIAEEIDRIRAHVAAARELLTGDAPSGRRFDFLAQEFIREANTLCSKAASSALTRVGLDLKAVIDQMREQVQNVE